jgi:hypothetical protein
MSLLDLHHNLANQAGKTIDKHEIHFALLLCTLKHEHRIIKVQYRITLWFKGLFFWFSPICIQRYAQNLEVS